MIEILFSSVARVKLLKILLLEGDGRFYVRELATRAGLPVTNVHQELANLLKAGVVVKEKSGHQVYYSIDTHCPIIPELRSIFIKTVGLADVLKASLSGLACRIDAAFIFGSVASATERTGSDVDLFVIGSASLGAVVQALESAEQAIRREVNPVIFSTSEFRERVESREHFVTSVLADAKLFLIGDENDLERIAGRGKA
jgi:predicted nucleotidyltransferase